MIPARVLGRDTSTGKIYQAMRGESVPKQWRWIEITHEHDKPITAGDLILDFPALGVFPMVPPAQSNVLDGA